MPIWVTQGLYHRWVPSFRSDVHGITPYTAGQPIDRVAAQYGFDPATMVKLDSNESPFPPFPEAIEAMRREVAESNRYPDNDWIELRSALASQLAVPPENIWIGGGTSELLRVIALASGGPKTSIVYGWPSFVIYRLAGTLAMSELIEVPLDRTHTYDLKAMAAAIRTDTTVVYVCNPNNPTGTIVSASALKGFIDQVPERVMVVVDEAYFEFVLDPGYATALSEAVTRPNVVVLRTFSKVYGLAGTRVGYAITTPENIGELRRAQAPFTVSCIAQAAAVESLRHPGRVAERVAINARSRSELEEVLAGLGVEYVPSQANFVYFRLPASTQETEAAFLRHGIIVRPLSGGWVRVTVGTGDENLRFLTALEAERDALT